MGYPIIAFDLKDENGKAAQFKWFPSEYLFRDGDKFCFAADKQSSSYEVMFGSTLMR